jgi:hypothetical protein
MPRPTRHFEGTGGYSVLYSENPTRGLIVEHPGVGKIEFEEYIDTTYVDWNGVVIQTGVVEVTNELACHPALVTLHGLFPKSNSFNNFEQKLQNVTERQGASFVGYSANSGTWQFRVPHFSRYGLADDSDEEDESAAPKKPAVVKPIATTPGKPVSSKPETPKSTLVSPIPIRATPGNTGSKVGFRRVTGKSPNNTFSAPDEDDDEEFEDTLSQDDEEEELIDESVHPADEVRFSPFD